MVHFVLPPTFTDFPAGDKKTPYVTNCYVVIITICYSYVNSKMKIFIFFLTKLRLTKRSIKMNEKKNQEPSVLPGLHGLKEIRLKKGFTQQKVALDLSISREALSYYENGRRSPDVQMLLLLSDYFDVSIDYLITGREFISKRQKNQF